MVAQNKTAKLSLKYNRKIRIFLFFLILTSIIWLLIELSKTYSSTTKIKIAYSNLPAKKLLLKKPLEEIEGEINATGFSLLKYKIKQPKVTLNLSNTLQKANFYYVLPNSQIASLNQKLSNKSKIIKFLTDTIYIELANNITKKVPITSKLKINFKVGYNLIEELKIIPDSIQISGPKISLDSISEISTNTLVLNEVYSNIKEVLKIKIPKIKNISMENSSVTIIGEVDKFTEGRFTFPVTIINKPEGVKISPFPKEIEVIYQAGLSNFSKIKKSNITVVFDYMQYENDSLVRYLSPVVEQKSDLISSLKINPSKIEFLIQKEW
jgi:hypothetical protein